MKAYTKKELYQLKAAINGFSEEARRIRKKEIRPKHLEEKAQGWMRKRRLGSLARYHQLAYAYMLGKKYSTVEKNRPLGVTENRWDQRYAAKAIMEICKIYGYRRTYDNLTIDSLIDWFKTDTNPFVWESKRKARL